MIRYSPPTAGNSPVGLKQKIKVLIKPIIAFLYPAIGYPLVRLYKRDNVFKKYDVTLCAIFRNEALFLKEWIDYHRTIGIEHFYLYNNKK